MKRSQDNRDSARPTCQFEQLEDRRLCSAGALDPSFSGDGKFAKSSGPSVTTFATDSAVQSDGKTVVVGFTKTGSDITKRFAVARFNFDGSLDSSFGPDHNGL